MTQLRTFLLFFSLISFVQLFCQNTVGLLSYDAAKVYDGYNLIYPHNQSNVYLLNNCGEIVHVWTDDIDSRPGNTVYITEDGNLIKTKRDKTVTDDALWAGGGGESIEIRDWANNLIWSYTLNNDSLRLHHDIAPLANGNILAVAWELKTENECLAAGRDTSTTDQDELWSEYIFEINPTDNSIVWEWHAWDHMIQDFDNTKSNFGVVSDHPELIDINYSNDGRTNFMHINAIDYNEQLKQILISVPYFDEIWVIDHTTSTSQAAGHSGGLSFKGGDLMYRWGNSKTYTKNALDSQYLYFQHDAHWVDDIVSPMNPQYGKIAVFNNRVGVDFSTVNVIAPAWDMYSWTYTKGSNGIYQPSEFDVALAHPTRTALYSTGLSSVQVLPNDNFLITSGRFGYTFEMTADQEIVWEYVTPLQAGQAVDQGTTVNENDNLTFRLKRYPADFPAFINRDLTPKGWIESMPDEGYCGFLLPVDEVTKQYDLKIYPNPATEKLIVEWEAGTYVDLEIFDIMGRRFEFFRATGGKTYIETGHYHKGIYLIRIDGQVTKRFIIAN